MKYKIIVRWKNAVGSGDHEVVDVEAKSRSEAEIEAENIIVSKYPNVYEPKALKEAA